MLRAKTIKEGTRVITFNEAIGEALEQSMRKNSNVFVIGLGVTDPKGIFGTTLKLHQIFGSNRVFDMPVSENAMTGIAIGAAISGMYPVMVHQRVDFVLLAMDQMVNNAAKWNYMFGGNCNVPLTIRTIIGKGWGQGPQHSQNFISLFSHIPGLKVVAPATPYEAKGLLIRSIEEKNPVIFIEHRWLANQVGMVPQDYYSLPLGKASVIRKGSDITVVAFMDLALQAFEVAERLQEQRVSVEIINPCSIKPLDEEAIMRSVAKTGRLLIIDPSWVMFGISAQISALVAEGGFDLLKAKIKRLGLPDTPTPTTHALSKYYYPSEADIAEAIGEILELNIDIEALGLKRYVPDVPDESFKGPF